VKKLISELLSTDPRTATRRKLETADAKFRLAEANAAAADSRMELIRQGESEEDPEAVATVQAEADKAVREASEELGRLRVALEAAEAGFSARMKRRRHDHLTAAIERRLVAREKVSREVVDMLVNLSELMGRAEAIDGETSAFIESLRRLGGRVTDTRARYGSLVIEAQERVIEKHGRDSCRNLDLGLKVLDGPAHGFLLVVPNLATDSVIGDGATVEDDRLAAEAGA